MFAATDSGLFASTDNGRDWTPEDSGISNLDVRSVYATGAIVFAGTYGAGVFLSTNNGGSWRAINSGLGTDLYVPSLLNNSTTVFAVTGDGSVLERPLLSQNYPNPFNPSTIIR